MFEAIDAMEIGSRDWGVETQALAEMWRRVSRQHLSSGQGCACGFGGGLMLQGAAFELDIVEFLINDAAKLVLAVLRLSSTPWQNVASINTVWSRSSTRWDTSILQRA